LSFSGEILTEFNRGASMKTMFASGLFGFVVLLLPISSRAVPGDEHWDAQFGAPGVTNNIYAIAVNNGSVYAAGGNPTGIPTNAPLYVWDGKQWSVPAVFSGSSFMQVSDLAFVGNTLYAAGSFTNVNGVTTGGLAKWDGTSWSGIGFSGVAYALAVDGNNLYVGGAYTNADTGGMMMTNIGYWDGSAWHALGNGLGLGDGSSAVRAIVIQNGLVYAGGFFTNSGAAFATNLAVWNGSAWTQVGGGVSSGSVLSLAFDGSDLYVGGFFSQVGTTSASSIAKWDGANWSSLDGGLANSPSAVADSLAVLNGMVCVAGSFTNAGGISASNFAVWNGSTWSAAGAGLSAVGVRAVSTGTNVYVGGTFGAANGVLANYIASWDGTQWTALGTPGRLNGIQGFVFALANDGTNLYAGGDFFFAGQTNANYIARFDGTNWHPMGNGISPAGGTTMVRALAVGNNNIYAGGSFSYAGNASALNVARWDGTNWHGLGYGPGGVVASLTVCTDGVYAAGAPLNGTSYGSPFFLRWDGTNWQDVLNYNPTDTFILFLNSDPNIPMDAVAFQDTNIYVGGNFQISWHDPTLTYETNCENIMRFDGSYARIVGTGLSSNVFTMALLGSNLYVGGLFTNAGGVTANKIAMWNGDYWTNVSSGVVGSGTVFALTTMGNDLYAGGSFTNMGGVPAHLIARWDGTNWSALGSGVGGRSAGVQSLGGFGSDLYVGGFFKISGNQYANDLARWNDQINFDTPQLLNPARLGNGQFSFRLAGISGLTNIIEATTDFTTWTPVLTNSAGIYDFTDPDAALYPFRYYRSVLGP
jgi:trimeric autotransporter adhesin